MTEPRRDDGADAWEAIADGWTERVRTNTDWVRPIILDGPHLEILGNVRGMRILDAGCGEGRFARMLADLGALVTAVDLSERMIANALQAEGEANPRIDYRRQSMCDLSDFADGSMDAAVAYLSLIDVPDYERAAQEIARVLKPGGQFVFSIVHPCFAPPESAWEPRTPGTIPIRDKDKLYKKVDNYFPAREIRFKMWPTAPAETLNYHRPLSEYAHALRAAGMRITDIHEPYPPEEVMAQRDYLLEFKRAPLFMILECVRPG
jgi:SAM-dependent methyltransferase